MSALDQQPPVTPGGESIGLKDGGSVVTVRRSRSRDLDALRALARRAAVVCDELELARLLRSDPSERLILCATTRDAGGEDVVGLGVIELGAVATMPSLILVDPEYGRPLARWLAETLVEHARAVA